MAIISMKMMYTTRARLRTAGGRPEGGAMLCVRRARVFRLLTNALDHNKKTLDSVRDCTVCEKSGGKEE